MGTRSSVGVKISLRAHKAPQEDKVVNQSQPRYAYNISDLCVSHLKLGIGYGQIQQFVEGSGDGKNDCQNSQNSSRSEKNLDKSSARRPQTPTHSVRLHKGGRLSMHHLTHPITSLVRHPQHESLHLVIERDRESAVPRGRPWFSLRHSLPCALPSSPRHRYAPRSLFRRPRLGPGRRPYPCGRFNRPSMP